MTRNQNEIELLNEIKTSLSEIRSKQESKELTSDANKLLSRSEKRADDSLTNIQTSFNRIHDKLFSLNNILIAAFLGLGKFPSDNPMIPLWLSILPIANLCFLIYLEITQMEIHRFASNEEAWQDDDRELHGRKIGAQNMRSLLAMLTTGLTLLVLVLSVFLF